MSTATEDAKTKTRKPQVAKPVVPPEPVFQCDFCKTKFKSERTLIAHACEKKRRWLWKDEKYAQMGFRAYQTFYKMSYRLKSDKTLEEFIDSRYYTGFTKFGWHLVNINAIEPQGFVEFLVKTNVKLEDWTAAYAYEVWVRELCKKESAFRAAERNILLMEQWARDTEENWFDFFRLVNPQLATKYIRGGRISPWLLYTVGEDLFERMSDEQLVMIKDWIDPAFWPARLATHVEEAEEIKLMLRAAGV